MNENVISNMALIRKYPLAKRIVAKSQLLILKTSPIFWNKNSGFALIKS
ncbi:hypothetical protein [Citrobacter freundii]|uniref:Uncharacterized protein n=1 Tax=Citrobacter freundii TaxID=546 RepID=A0A7G2IHZ0_CITFR|nr:hypothetical protein [Citrobacter freundii]